jgi:hypothetical protein
MIKSREMENQEWSPRIPIDFHQKLPQLPISTA